MKPLLIVDDELGIVDSLSLLLEEEGYRVSSAANGRDGLEKLAEDSFGLLIVDVMMPIMGGLDMLRKVRSIAQHASTPAILISAAPKWAIFPPGQERAEDASAPPLYQAFLQKPFDLDRLLSTIERLAGPGQPPSAGGGA